jgi:hypothetical protein
VAYPQPARIEPQHRQQPTKRELVIKIAKARGVDVPPMILARADEAMNNRGAQQHDRAVF